MGLNLALKETNTQITAAIHSRLTNNHTFSASYNGQVPLNIEKAYNVPVHFKGYETKTGTIYHKGSVPYSGAV